MRACLISAFASIVVSFAYGQASDAVSIARTPKVGDTVMYTVKMDLDYGVGKANLTGKVEEQVTKVEANGDYTIESKYTQTIVKAGATENDLTHDADVSVYKANGAFLKLLGTKVEPSMVRLANLVALVLPAKPVKIGDTWSYDIAADPATGAVAAKVDYKMTAREKVGAFDCVAVLAKFRELSGDKPQTCDETVWLEVGTGLLVKREAVIKNAPTRTAVKQTISATLSVARDQPKTTATPPVKTSGGS